MFFFFEKILEIVYFIIWHSILKGSDRLPWVLIDRELILVGICWSSYIPIQRLALKILLRQGKCLGQLSIWLQPYRGLVLSGHESANVCLLSRSTDRKLHSWFPVLLQLGFYYVVDFFQNYKFVMKLRVVGTTG